LARAAYDLQSRLWNIIKGGFVKPYLESGTDREKKYVIDNTVYVIAQFFCWVEIVRKEIRYIDLGKEKDTRSIQGLQDDITGLWQSDKSPPKFRIWAGEQRAIGEALIKEDDKGPYCIGYYAFISKFPEGSNEFIDELRKDVASLKLGIDKAVPRLKLVQHKLISLLDLLDPRGERFPKDRREEA
jgi:hypothetical protein